MPATYSPSEIERKHRDPEDGDHGGGRRPPTDKRTGGGGDPENWNDRRRGRRDPRERINRYRVGLFLILSAVIMFFIAVVSVFFVSQSSAHFDANARYINDWLPTALPPILWLDSAVLLISSLTIEIARRHMFREMHVMDEWLGFGKPTSRRAMPWVGATIFLGTLFVAGQFVAWRQLASQHVFYNSSASSESFFLITGIHGAHLIIGVGLLIAALIALFVSRQIENRQIFVDIAAWYWHTMGVLWLLLFGLLTRFQ
jgi:cytochrome c oxidase subunit 3